MCGSYESYTAYRASVCPPGTRLFGADPVCAAAGDPYPPHTMGRHVCVLCLHIMRFLLITLGCGVSGVYP